MTEERATLALVDEIHVNGAEVLEPGQRTLRELADDANREHGRVLESGRSMVEHAIAAGEYLIAAKKQCPRGEWSEWCRENIEAALTTRCLYMRVARFQATVRASGITSLKTVRAYLAKVEPAVDIEGYSQLGAPPPHIVDAVIELRGDGLSWSAIGRELGVSPMTAKRYGDPDYRRRCRDKEKARARRRNEAQRRADDHARSRAIGRAVKKAGAAMAEAWTMAERMQDVIAQAQRETEDREAREALSRAGEHYRKMRDEIVRALGVA